MNNRQSPSDGEQKRGTFLLFDPSLSVLGEHTVVPTHTYNGFIILYCKFKYSGDLLWCFLYSKCVLLFVCVCVCITYLKESRRDWSHWHALSWGKVPKNRAGSCRGTLKDVNTNINTHVKNSLKHTTHSAASSLIPQQWWKVTMVKHHTQSVQNSED